jgi:hypothetical protein
MTPDLTLALRQNTCRRAHIAGAEAASLATDGFLAEAAEARRRYFRELEACDILGGHTPSPFAPLG